LSRGKFKTSFTGLRDKKAKIIPMQNVEKGRLLEVATKPFLEKQGFRVYSWQEWALQKGLNNLFGENINIMLEELNRTWKLKKRLEILLTY
jgi:hypothetical protein